MVYTIKEKYKGYYRTIIYYFLVVYPFKKVLVV
jgi:hypothetical protein